MQVQKNGEKQWLVSGKMKSILRDFCFFATIVSDNRFHRVPQYAERQKFLCKLCYVLFILHIQEKIKMWYDNYNQCHDIAFRGVS